MFKGSELLPLRFVHLGFCPEYLRLGLSSMAQGSELRVTKKSLNPIPRLRLKIAAFVLTVFPRPAAIRSKINER